MKRTLFFICTLLCANVILAQTRFWIDSLQYEVTSINPAKVEVYDANYSITTAIIPAIVTYQETTYDVTSIGNRAFDDCSSLNSVTIPNSVTYIGNSAFEYCSSLTSINIPNSVTSIGNSAFEYCSSLNSVTIPNSVTSIGNSAFGFCSSLTSVTLPNSVTSIGNSVFHSCISLTSVTIPNSVTYIGNEAFGSCSSLTSINIPNSVTSIGNSAFGFCSSLTSVTLPENATIDNSAFDNVGTRVVIDSLTYSRPSASLMVGFNTFNVGFTTFYVGDNVYRNPVVNVSVIDCDTRKSGEEVILSSIEINDMEHPITSIGYQAFAGCRSLTSVTIPNSVTSIGNKAFEHCSSLTSVTFGESITSIASGAFNDCFFLQNVTCLATTPPTLEDNTVFPYPNIATLTVPCGTLEAYSSPTSYWNVLFNGRISESGYNVEVSVNNDAWGSVAVESNCSTATLTATASEGYEFIIWNDGNTENPRIVNLTSDTAFTAIFAEINESSLMDVEDAELSFYPNPTDSKITFSSIIESIEVIDLTGRCVLTFSNTREINIELLPAGAYYLRLTNNDKAVMRKVIKE